MFKHGIPEIPYTDPWAEPFDLRFNNLRRGQRRVAYFYEKPDNSTFRYRVYNMIQALGGVGDVSASYFTLEDIGHMSAVIDACDVLVVCRCKYSDTINRLVTLARSRERPVFFDVDDFVFDTRYAHMIVNTLDQDLAHPEVWNFWFAYLGRLGATLRLCDGAIVTNSFLAERVRAFADVPVSIIPNFMNMEQLGISREIFTAKRRSGYARDDKIHIGYFSGTPTHNRDFAIVARAIARVLDNDPRLVLRAVGYLDVDKYFPQHACRVEYHPFQDFINLQRLVGSTEINLVPLQDNIFTNCKSELKYFEAAAVGTATIATPTAVFASAIRPRENGFLARAYEWEDQIVQVVDAIDGGYADVAERAFEHVEERYTPMANSGTIANVLFPQAASHPAQMSENAG